MTDDLPDWPRQHFGRPGGKPMLFYAVFGEFGTLPELSSEEYRCEGVPMGMHLQHYSVDEHAAYIASFREGYLWETFNAKNPELAAKVAESQECLILRGEVEDRPSLNYFRDAIGLLTFLLDNGGIAVYDPFIFHWWESGQWRERAFDADGPAPRHHVVVLTSEESDPSLTWFHTRGLRKFGRPDLSIRNVPREYNDAVIDLCERFIELQAFGGIIEEGMDIRMKSLPEGMTCHHGGDLEDPDFNDVHVEIVWPDGLA